MEMSRRQEQRVMQGPRAGSSSAGEVCRAARRTVCCWLLLLVGLVIPLSSARAHVRTATVTPHALNWLAGVDYPAGWQLIAEYNGTGTLQRKYVYGPGIDEPLRMTNPQSPTPNHYFHSDGLGSVTEVTTNGGFKVESCTYDVYGTPTMYNAAGSVISTPSTGNRLLFTGRDRDPDTILYNPKRLEGHASSWPLSARDSVARVPLPRLHQTVQEGATFGCIVPAQTLKSAPVRVDAA